MCALAQATPTGSDETRVMLTQMSQALDVMKGTITTLQGHERRLAVNEALDAAQEVAITDLKADVGILKQQMNTAIRLRSSEKKNLRKAVAKVVYQIAADQSERPQHFSNVHSGLREYFDVSEYADIPSSRFIEAMKLVSLYDGTGKSWWKGYI